MKKINMIIFTFSTMYMSKEKNYVNSLKVELDNTGHWDPNDEGSFKDLYKNYHTKVGDVLIH